MTDGAEITRLSDTAFQPSPTVANEVRRALRVLLVGWELTEQLLTDVLLVVEEFVANVVDHAGTAFDLTIERGSSVLRVAVRDRCERPAVVRTPDPSAPRGRGLQIVSAVAQSWGCDRDPGGKTVWASLAA